MVARVFPGAGVHSRVAGIPLLPDSSPSSEMLPLADVKEYRVHEAWAIICHLYVHFYVKIFTLAMYCRKALVSPMLCGEIRTRAS